MSRDILSKVEIALNEYPVYSEKKWTGTLKKGFNVVMDEVELFDLFY